MAMMMNPPLSPGSSSRPPSRGRNTNPSPARGGGRFLTRTRSPSPVPFIHQQQPHNNTTNHANTASNMSSSTKIRGRSVGHRRTNSTDSSASTNLNSLTKHNGNKTNKSMTSKEMELLKKKFPTLVAQMEKDAAVSNSVTENYFDYYSGVPNGAPPSSSVGAVNSNGYRANAATPSNGGGSGNNTQYRNLTSKFSYDEAERMSNVSSTTSGSKKSSTIRSMSPARMLSRLHHKDSSSSNKNHGGGRAHTRVGSGGSGNSGGGATPGRASSVNTRGAQQQQQQQHHSPQHKSNEENVMPVMITHTTTTPTRRSSPSPARTRRPSLISPVKKRGEHQRDHSWGASSQFSSLGNNEGGSHNHNRSGSGSSGGGGGRNVYIGPIPVNTPQFEFADDIRSSSRPSSRSNSRQRTQQQGQRQGQQQPYPLVPTVSNQSSTFQGDNFFSSSNSVYGDGSTTFDGGSSIGDYSKDGDSQILFDVLNDDSGGYFADGVGNGVGGVDDDLEKIIGGYVGSGKKKKKNKMKEMEGGINNKQQQQQQQTRDGKKLYDMVKGVSSQPSPPTSVPIWNEQYGDDTDDSLTDDDYGENNNGGREGTNTKNKNKVVSVVSPDKYVKKKGDNKVDGGGSAEEDTASSPTSISSLFNCGGFGAADISETLRQLFSSFTGGDVEEGGGGGANVVEDTTRADEEERELMEKLERVREKKRRGGGMDKVRARLQHSN